MTECLERTIGEAAPRNQFTKQETGLTSLTCAAPIRRPRRADLLMRDLYIWQTNKTT
ncbi:hypothetical protein AtDm6_0160 [Acetobacter tropicalis]|uniref:Uncharacterized protein n=1 Tax=Acetobacter tropicalis TaxID=104102 RepID=A0A094YYI5_9PROT|nr:hypothetical protein AtDm6_0160 [Acetobacter tropicalis]